MTSMSFVPSVELPRFTSCLLIVLLTLLEALAKTARLRQD